MPEKAKHRAQVTFSVSVIAVVAFVTLFLISSRQSRDQLATSRYELTQAVTQLNREIALNNARIVDACEAGNLARKQGNEQVRKPLKQMLDYFSLLIKQSEGKLKAQGKPVPKLTLQAERKFEMFSRQVTFLPQRDCTPGGG